MCQSIGHYKANLGGQGTFYSGHKITVVIWLALGKIYLHLIFKKSLAKLAPKQNKLKSYTCLFILNVNEKTSTLLTEVYTLTMVLTLSFFLCKHTIVKKLFMSIKHVHKSLVNISKETSTLLSLYLYWLTEVC